MSLSARDDGVEFRHAAYRPAPRRCGALPAALPLARRLGGAHVGYGCEVEDASGAVVRLALTAGRDAYRLAVIPAALAACALARGGGPARGVVPPHLQVDADELLHALQAA